MPKEFSTAELEELKELNNYTRETWQQYMVWWAFFVTANLVAGGFVGKELIKIEYETARRVIAAAVIAIDLLGAWYVFAVSVRLVQFDDRITEICTGRANLDKALSRHKLLAYMVARLLHERVSDPKECNSPVPVRFYLACTAPVICFAIPAIIICWCTAF